MLSRNNMFKTAGRGYRKILLLSTVVLVMSLAFFLYTAHTKWPDLKWSGQSVGSSALQSYALLFRGFSLDKLKEDVNGTIGKPEVPSIENVTKRDTEFDNREHDNDTLEENNECPEGSVYFSNDLYDCDGIMKTGEDDKAKPNNNEKEIKDKIELESFGVPTSIKHLTPTHLSKAKKAEYIPSKIFVNCGGTFPWVVELFLNTYPDSASYEIFTFLSEMSYKVMYSKFPNHTVLAFEASYQNGSKHVDVKPFGADAEITLSIIQIDLAEWLKANTKISDFVILRIDSTDEVKILKHFNSTGVFDYIDKYYFTQRANALDQELEVLLKVMTQFKVKTEVWDTKALSFSDFNTINQNHIPTPGKLITVCQQRRDEENFALFLFSPFASVNALKVIDLLQIFSPKDRLQLTVFLPYEFFQSGFLNMKTLFRTFHVGMYHDGSGSNADDKLRHNMLLNRLTFVRRLFDKYENLFQYVFVGNYTSQKVFEGIQENHHYSFVKGGKDITHLTKKTLEGKTVSIDDTGKGSGDFLVVNIDTANAEYLVLYMVRRFAPWLLNLSECDVTSSN